LIECGEGTQQLGSAPTPTLAQMAGGRALQDYRRYIAARFTPVVAVVTSPDVDAACAASGLSFGRGVERKNKPLSPSHFNHL